jgi:hypothetical protein
MARREDPTSILRTYDSAHEAVLALLDGIRDDEGTKSTYTLGRVMTIHELFHIHPAHFRDHLPDVERALQ